MTRTSLQKAIAQEAKKHPQALSARYATSKPNEEIALHQGPFVVLQGGAELTTTGIIRYEWLPTPRVTMSFDNLSGRITVGEAQLRIEKGPECPILITDAPLGTGPDSGVCRALASGAVLTEQRGDAVEVHFDIVNLPEFTGRPIRNAAASRMWMGRLTYHAGDWEVVVDQAPDFDVKVARQLRAVGGFMITHTGLLRRRDGGSIDIETAREQIKVLSYVFSFYRGAWTSPFLLAGLDASGTQVWQAWNSPRSSQWTFSHQNWGSGVSPKHALFRLHEALLGPWSEALRLAIHWYVEANNDTIAESSIVRCQIALELLSWEILVTRDKSLSKIGHGKLPAADTFRLMMASRGIPLSLPTPLTDLNKLVKGLPEEASDAAGAFVWLRNAIVHNDEKKREALKKSPARSRSQGRALGLWMVELIILAVAGYEYEYADRLDTYTVKRVPWSSQGITFAAAMADAPQPGVSATVTNNTNAPRSKPTAEKTGVKPRGRGR